MKTMKKQYRSTNNQHKLKVLCDQLCDRIEELFDYFELDYRRNGKLYSMCCPIHNGDNDTALNIYPEGETYRGNWKCRTHNCEQVFKGSVIGFVRGILSSKNYNWQKSGDDTCSFDEAVKFCENFTNTKLDEIKISKSAQNKKRFASAINNIAVKTNIDRENLVTRSQIIKNLEIPSQYYIDRGYSPDILTKYDIGLCTKPNKEMSNRVVVPIYDSSYQYMVGCTGRSLFTKCEQCKGYHENNCPSKEELFKYSKWKHNNGFKTQEHLYNFWFAKEHIQKEKYVIIVESPGNVWRLEENNIHNSVAIFGTNLSNQQKLLLDGSGAMSIVVIMDNDEAGRLATNTIIQKCDRTYNMYSINIEQNDIGEMTNQQIEEQIVNKIKEFSL